MESQATRKQGGRAGRGSARYSMAGPSNTSVRDLLSDVTEAVLKFAKATKAGMTKAGVNMM